MKSTESILNNELDKLARYLLDKNELAFSECVQNWFRNNYQCEMTPKPLDTDALRLAVKASIIERLVEVLNSPPRNGQQTAPAWCKDIRAVDRPFKLQSDRLLDGEDFCETFEKRNLHVVKNFMYFI
jgi:hypothetical protein